MSKGRYDDFLLAFGKANTFVFQSSAAMQKAAASMWNDIKNKPDELNTFLKEVTYSIYPYCTIGGFFETSVAYR